MNKTHETHMCFFGVGWEWWEQLTAYIQGSNSWTFKSLKLEEVKVHIVLEEHIREHSPRTSCTKNSKEPGCGSSLNRMGWRWRKVERVENGMRIRWKRAIQQSALSHLRRLAFKHIHPVQLQLHFRNQEISWVAKKDRSWQLSLFRLSPSHWESK